MTLHFDRPSDPPGPLAAELAVRRGVRVVNGPVFALLVLCIVVPIPLVSISPWFFLLCPLLWCCAWAWWSYAVPQWRDWALARGADPVRLQRLGQAARLVWPKGHPAEATEIHRDRRDYWDRNKQLERK